MNPYKYQGQHVEIVASHTSSGKEIFYVRINGIQQIDYARGRGDFSTEALAANFAESLIDDGDFE